ncbi:TetR/AcrR family transcriptional regulator [Dactylosporangium sp. NPDC000244]|uniref:TetR/AcrR family transcriptional regulator n=1 Tax=Dactylosporangium sp. NPDC000244 TaxID=3154365 RepID=UPI00332A42C2
MAERPSGRGETYGGQSREERAADRRERLVAAAVQLFAGRDYDDVTVADVCTLAKVSKRYFYDHFADRDALVLTLHREVNGWLLTEVAAAAPHRADGLYAALRPMLAALVRLLAEHPERARIVYINAPRMELRRRGVLREEAELFGRVLAPLAPKLRADTVRYERTVLALIAGISEVLIDWVWHDMRDPAEPLVDHLTGLCVALLGHQP